MRAKKIGHVLVNMTVDRPWSQYFCCVLAGNREVVRRNPVATKRAMRAILKGADLCATRPEPTARLLAGRAFSPSFEAALQTFARFPTPDGATSTPKTRCDSTLSASRRPG